MKWFIAHAILYTRFKDGNQNIYPIWENMYLIGGDDSTDVFQKAIDRAKRDTGDSSGSYTYDGRPATWEFAGIRKIIECVDSPEDGVEVSYSTLEVSTYDALERLARGDTVDVTYVGDEDEGV